MNSGSVLFRVSALILCVYMPLSFKKNKNIYNFSRQWDRVSICLFSPQVPTTTGWNQELWIHSSSRRWLEGSASPGSATSQGLPHQEPRVRTDISIWDMGVLTRPVLNSHTTYGYKVFHKFSRHFYNLIIDWCLMISDFLSFLRRVKHGKWAPTTASTLPLCGSPDSLSS